jgi:DNA-binding IclR family transcriptional regulator
MVCIAVMRAHASAAPTSRIGGRIPTHATAVGKAMLAFSDDADTDALLSSRLTAWTSQTIIDPERLASELADIRQRGFAVELGEFADDVSAVACPVFSPSGALVAAISVSGRFGDFDSDRSASYVRAASLALTRRLAPSANASIRGPLQ